jgi:predicted enzyme related to lactoylglutathione lyase
MADPVVHFEIIGTDPAGLRQYYAELFGWQFAVDDAVTEQVSAPGEYGFVDGTTTGEGTGLNGGVGGGPRHTPKSLFYVSVPDVEAALAQAERLGGQRVFGPEGVPGKLIVGQFTDPEGNLVGVAGTA